MSIAEVSVSRPDADVERLLVEIETLKERLEIAAAPTLSPCSPGRFLWTFFVTEAHRDRIAAAIECIDRAPLSGADSDADRIAAFCEYELYHRQKRSRVFDASRKWNHAGLAWLATECDWLEVVGRYGTGEAADLVDSLRRTRGEVEAGQIVEAFFAGE